MRINALGNTATDFASDDYIAIDGSTNGSRKMKNDSIKQNVLADNVAAAFDPTRTSSNPYLAGEVVVRNGFVYKFKNNHYGAWSDIDGYKIGVLSEMVKSWALLVGNRYYKVARIGRWLWLAENLDEALGAEGIDYVNYSGNNAPNFGKYYTWSALCKSDGSNSDYLLGKLNGNTHFHVPNATDFNYIATLRLENSALPTSLWGQDKVQVNSNGLSLVPSYRDGIYSNLGQYQLWSSVSVDASNATRYYGGYNVSAFLNASNSATKSTRLPVRLCAEMTSYYDDPRDYGCVEFVFNEKMPIVPKSGEYLIKSQNGILYPSPLSSETFVVKKQTKKLPTLRLITSKKYFYADGTQPKCDWYLMVDYTTLKFYSTRDFKNFEYLLTWSGSDNLWDYSFAIRENNDIIAVFRTDAIWNGTYSHDDSLRRNPSVFLFSENYATRHEIEFGASVKPSGWLSNCGFVNLPNGDSLFCEYTRPNVNTCRIWKIAANANVLLAASYQNTLTYTLSGHLINGMKHFHCVQFDPYTGIVYATTGDDNVGATVVYSTDGGDNWSDAYGGGSEKYCRLLSFNFTEDYVYWASDTPGPVLHYLFRAARGGNGVIDYSTIEELVHISDNSSTYGTSYLPEYNAIVLNERIEIGTSESVKNYIYDIDTGTFSELCTMHSWSGNALSEFGFRTEYTEFNPSGNVLCYGFSERERMNLFKGLGNLASDPNVVGTLLGKVCKRGSTYSVVWDTAWI